MQVQNLYLEHLIDPSFRGADRLFALLFKDNTERTGYIGCFLLSVEIKGYSVIIDSHNFFIHQ